MPKAVVEFYEQGMCGDPRVEDTYNPLLKEVNKVIKELEAEGVTVTRFLPSENMVLFMRNPKIAALIMEQRWRVLPVTIVNGEVIKVKEYPTLKEIRDAIQASSSTPEVPRA